MIFIPNGPLILAPVPESAAPFAEPADPHRDVGGLERPVHGAGQVVPDPVQVHGVLQPRRSGVNNAAAASVAAATATGEFTASTSVASRTSPAYTPISSPVTIA